jgi:hypothetical protein
MRMNGATDCRERFRLFEGDVRPLLASPAFSCVFLPIARDAPFPADDAIRPGYRVILKKVRRCSINGLGPRMHP